MNREGPMPGALADFIGPSDESTGSPDETLGTPASVRRYPFRPVLGLAVAASLGLLATAGVKSYRDLAATRDHEQKLMREIAGANERIRALHGRIESIQNDPAVLERLAREDLGLVREGDVVIVLPEPPPESPEPPPPAVDSPSP